jgi:hypothetical protein
MLENDTSLQSSPQLVLVEQPGVVVALSTKQVMSLFKKSEQSGIPFDTLKEVYQRGYAKNLSEQIAYNRVNSFIAGGAAMELDEDLAEKRGLWDNIHAKRNRIKHGSGEHMRKPGSKGAPTASALKNSQTETADLNIKGADERKKDKQRDMAAMIKFASTARRKIGEQYTGAEKASKSVDEPSNRFVGTDALTNNYRNSTPGQTLATIKKVVKEHCGCKKEVDEDAKGYKNPTGGLTQKGRDHYNRETGSHLKAPVTKEPSKLKAGSKAANRRKSFCARMGGVEGPMKKPNGEPTRKALALRKWNC